VTFALVLGAGNYAQRLLDDVFGPQSLSQPSLVIDTDATASHDTDVVEPRAHRPYIKISQTQKIIECLDRHEIRKVAIGGNFSAIDAQSDFSNVVPFHPRKHLVFLKQLEKAVRRAEDVSPVNIREILPEYAVKKGVMTCGETADEPVRALARRTIERAREQINRNNIPAGARQAVLFEGDSIILEDKIADGTDALLEIAKDLPAPTAPRILIKLSPDYGDLNFDPPVIKQQAVELAAAADIKILITDARCGVLAGGEQLVRSCNARGIALIGWAPGKDLFSTSS